MANTQATPYTFTEKKRIRKSFAKRASVLPVPFLLETQLASYRAFLQEHTPMTERKNEGLQAAFTSIFPISSHSGNARLEFVGYSLPFVDGRDNGGVTFHGWDKNEVLVRALIQANADTRAEAEALAKEIRILTDMDRVRADGPSSRRYRSWSVSYEVWVPRKIDLDAETHNGGIQVEGVEGRMSLHGVNGGITLRDVAGDVRAETTNGGAAAYLSGSSWRGAGLDLETTNGGVTLELPRNFNAELETGTVNGGLNIDFPITVSGFVSRRIRTKLGNGGPRIRALTTNGGVRIRASSAQD